VVQLQQQVEDLRQTLEITLSRDSRDHIQHLLNLSEDTFHALINQYLIESLAFHDMYGRFDTIAKAHYDTFKWIFYGDTNSDGSADNADDITRSIMEYSYDERQDAYRDSARDSFLSWLSSDYGIFHICGKLGSGKSTLMKFLCEDARTKEVLKQWAGDRTLVMAQFFFWKPGSKMQKSMDGLLRALLYETLKSSPALAPTILPEQWNAISSTPWQMHTKLELRPETIREAFCRLIDSHTEDLAICFFIDGLDEYEQTLQEDHLTMIERLDSWCGGTDKNVKICVSSREYNVFMNHLPSRRRIRMQDLTDKDIRLYIQDKTDFAESPEQAQYLVETIAAKADGIFLWVALVVTRARELHENSVGFGGILDEVDRVPRGLEELFKHILESLEPSDRMRAYQTFAMMMRLHRKDIHFPLLAYAFIDDYDKQSQAVDAPLPASSRKPESINDLKTQAVKKLRGYCKGLVENATTDPARPEIWEWEILQFCHRSVSEFLGSHMLGDRAQYMRSFKEEDAISWLLLAYIRKHSVNGYRDRGWLARLSYIILKLRHDANLVNEPFDFEEQLETALARQGMGVPENGYKALHLQSGHESMTIIMTLHIGDGHQVHSLATPYLISCYLGHSAYLRWKLDRSAAITDSPARKTLIFFTINNSPALSDAERKWIFQALLNRGFSPHTVTTTGADSDMTRTRPTVWEQFVAYIFLRSVEHKVNMRLTHKLYPLVRGYDKNQKEKEKQIASTFLRLFLESGADASIAIFIPREAVYATLLRGKERHRLQIPEYILNDIKIPFFRRNTPFSFCWEDGSLRKLSDIIEFVGFEDNKILIHLVRWKILSGFFRSLPAVYLLGEWDRMM
jgi:hypothetical protein